MSAREAWCDTPAWELDVLLSGDSNEDDEEDDDPGDGVVSRDIDPDRELADPPVPQGIPGL